MARYMKKATVVEAIQVVSTIDMGLVGNFKPTDWLLMDVEGSFHKYEDEVFKDNYRVVSSDVALQGEDV